MSRSWSSNSLSAWPRSGQNSKLPKSDDAIVEKIRGSCRCWPTTRQTMSRGSAARSARCRGSGGVNAKQWISFVRLYGPIPTKDNLYDENLRRQARRKGISQILFEHPYEPPVMGCFD